MKIIYLLSVILLFLSFLLLKKSAKKESIVCFIIYSIGLKFCYNIVIVFFNKLLGINGSLLNFSIINFIIFLILMFVSYKRKEFQKYYFKKEEFFTVLAVVIVGVLVGLFRFRGFTVIAYESGDSSIHFRAADYFSKSLSYLDKSNSSDIMYTSFDRMMPISYINGGLFINLFSFIKNYIAFIIYDILCFILISLVFVITIFNFYNKKSLNYVYVTIISLLYSLGFPLNNMLFGFCYLGLGIMVFNLLLNTINLIKDFSKQKIYNIVVIFILVFSVFHSYYLFMPPIYLSLGIYYIYLFRKKDINFKEMMLYGIVTLIIPFILGFCHYILPDFLKNDGGNIFTNINIWGYIYTNFTAIISFGVVFLYLIYRFAFKRDMKFNYFNLNLIVFTFYILLFLMLYCVKLSEIYYLYKLFYVYFIFIVIIVYDLFVNRKEIIYAIFALLVFSTSYIIYSPFSSFASFLTKANIYNWNALTFNDKRILFDKSEIELMEESIKYRDECLDNDEFLLFGWNLKNLWFYSITDSIPIVDHEPGWGTQLQKRNVYFDFWDSIDGHNCVIYYYEDNYPSSKLNTYDILYQNRSGAIVKRYEED